jgi:ABC-type branched-subunit amino acid transport system ATPase component
MNVHVSAKICRRRPSRADDGIAKGSADLLKVDNISLRFGGVKAITDISFDIKKGEIRAIIGPNGAGKTSMLNVINGFYHPQEGDDHLSRQEAPARCARTRRAARGHRAHLPEHRAVQGHVDARQHHDRPHHAA